MSNIVLDNATLLTNLGKAVWGDQAIFKRQLDPGTGHPHTVDYLDFGEHLTAIKVIAPTIRFPRFLVREEYRHALEAFEKDDVYIGGACIMGQPGIGKSCFIAYAVIERLRNKQPVAVQIHSDSYALFSEDGLSFHASLDQQPLRLHRGIWAFSDSNADVNIPAFAFRSMTPDVKVFQTTSPKISRWKEWTKQTMIRRYIMDVWSSEEITALAVLLGLDPNRMNDLASKWGRVPRTLLLIFGNDQEYSFELEMRSIALGAIHDCRNTLHSMMSPDATPSIDSGPSSIFFMGPKKTGDSVSRVLHDIWIPTQTIIGILGAAVCSAADRDRQDFFNALIKIPKTRGAAGYIFETWIHSFLSSGNPIQCHWHGKPDKSLPSALRLANPGQWVSTNDELRETPLPFYWRTTRDPDFEGIDGALFDVEDNVYAIQITIASKHKSPQRGLEKLRDILKEEKKKEKKKSWRVLFIGNTLEQSETVSREWIDKLHVDKSGALLKKSTPVPVGWCVTSPLDAEIAVVNTLTPYVPPEADGE